jgi:hypothetical protein
MLTEEEIDKQIDEHMDVINPEHILIAYKNNESDLCSGAQCPDNFDKSLTACNKCFADYNLKELIEVQPHLNWENLKETILMAQVLGIKSQTNK